MQLQVQNGKVVYSDGASVEEQMLAIARAHPEKLSADVIADDSRYTINNTFSPVRHNLLNWYPFLPDSDILEVGAGMGSMTGLLCDVAKSVTALEMNSNRAEVISARFPKRDNLTVLNADITTWKTEKRFNYIVIVGVLEYAGVFGNDSTAATYIRFMDSVRCLLKEDGVVLLAIENRFGLKYWLGGAEDHLQKPFLGIAGYKEAGTPKTFSKAELEAIFSAAGFKQNRFYYVLPDYKFPTVVFTDDCLPETADLRNVHYTYSRGTTLIMDERELYPDILDNKLFPEFANSYLVEACVDSLPEQHIVRVNGRGECKPEYRTVTTIDAEGIVCKKAGDERADTHIKGIYANYNELIRRGVRHIDYEHVNGGIYSSVCPLPMADRVFQDGLMRGDWELVRKIIDQLRASLVLSSDETEEKTHLLDRCADNDFEPGIVLENGYIDLTLYNAFWDEKEEALIFFDQEWIFPYLPLRFLLYYGVKNACQKITGESMIPFAHILAHIGVRQEESKIWDALESLIWEEVLTRTYNEYGADGYCNQFDDEMLLDRQNWRREEAVKKQVENLNHIIAEKESLIQEKEAEYTIIISEKESLIADRDNIIAERDGAISELRNLIEQKNTQKKQLRTDLRTQRRLAVRRFKSNRLLKKKNIYLSKRDRRLKKILNSRSWRYARKFARIVRVIFPKRAIHTRAIRGLKRFLSSPRKRRRELQKYTPIAFPAHNDPLVTIVIPVHNQFSYTYRCLKSIKKTCGDISYEVIVTDDASTDLTKKIGMVIQGVRLIRNNPALLFLKNCNRAAALGHGKYLVLLNNDTVVHKDWLQNMLKLAEADENIGIVGSKLLFKDGKLQEAGGIIWSDGRGWNYGRGGDPEMSEYNYVKEVDYVSGCSLMIRKSLWDEIGGFDERFVPAYYEDTDLAFEARKRGYKVVYQPLSVVTHFEGVSNGTDLSSGIKAYQAANQVKFAEKWKDVLGTEQFASEKDIFRARGRLKEKGVVVVVDHYIPTFDKDAGSRSMYEYIQLFQSMNNHVILLPSNFHRMKRYTKIYQQMGVEVLYGNWYYNHWREWIEENHDCFDVFFLSRPHVSIDYIDFCREKTDAVILYCGVDLHFLREQRQYEVTKDPELLLSLEKWKKMELELINKADCSLYPSIEEEKYIKSIWEGARVETYPVYFFTDIPKKQYDIKGRKDIMFLGGFNHLPNRDAMLWFAEEIFPLILKKMPDIKLHILGSNATDAVKNLASKHIIFKGFVTDEELEIYYQSMRLTVIPLRYGAGIKGKVVEAMRFGLPIITTSIGAEGYVDAEKYMTVENEAEKIADAVCALYDDAEKLSAMTLAAYDYLENTFSAENAKEVLIKAMAHRASTEDFDAKFQMLAENA